MDAISEAPAGINDLLSSINKPAEQLPAVKERRPITDEQYWLKRGYFKAYTLGKTSAGLNATGELREFLARLFVMVKAYVKQSAEENGKRIDAELFDLMNNVMSMIWRATGSDVAPTVEQSANFLAMLNGFMDNYIASTKITEKI